MKKLFILTFLLTSCAASEMGYKHWHKNGKTLNEFAKTKYLCLHETGQTNAFVNIYSDAFFVTCMNAHGYYLSKKDAENE